MIAKKEVVQKRIAGAVLALYGGFARNYRQTAPEG